MTRKEKRQRESNVNYFFEFMLIKKHFFKDLTKLLKGVNDKRHKSYIEYEADLLIFLLICKNACSLNSMRSMTNSFNRNECIENIGKILGYEGLKELPHYDTANNFLAVLPIEELGNIRIYMIKELLKKRCFEDYRLNNKRWIIAVDATGLFSFNEKHCEHCLRKEITNKITNEKRTIYYHNVLEAKLIIGDMVFSIATEFVENENVDVLKQDCELKAFKRLAAYLKNTFKRLPICILGDSLYSCETIFKICDENNWKYLLRFKEGRIPSLHNEFEMIKGIENMQEVDGITWVNDVSYNERKLNMIELEVEENEEVKRFVFVTNIAITKRNSAKIVAAGRSRWKIENEGFNNQKTKKYEIEHANSMNYNAMKNHYIITQITDIIMQLYSKGFELLKELKKTMKEISSNLLESIRTLSLTVEDINSWETRRQIRFLE